MATYAKNRNDKEAKMNTIREIRDKILTIKKLNQILVFFWLKN